MSIFDRFRQQRLNVLALPAGPSTSYQQAEERSKQEFLTYVTDLENRANDADRQANDADRQMQALSEQIRESHHLLTQYKKRLQELPRIEQKRVILTLIPFFDNLDYARASVKTSDQWSQGLYMLQQSREQQLKQLHVVTFGQDGETFHPQWHEARDKEMGLAHEDTIAYVYACGYRFDDGNPLQVANIIRPAQVKVAIARYSVTA